MRGDVLPVCALVCVIASALLLAAGWQGRFDPLPSIDYRGQATALAVLPTRWPSPTPAPPAFVGSPPPLPPHFIGLNVCAAGLAHPGLRLPLPRIACPTEVPYQQRYLGAR